MSSPTARSLELLRELGYTAKVVEHWNQYAKIRQDLFGVDILALKPGEPVLVVPGHDRQQPRSPAHEADEQASTHCGRAQGHSWKSGPGRSKDRGASGRSGR